MSRKQSLFAGSLAAIVLIGWMAGAGAQTGSAP